MRFWHSKTALSLTLCCSALASLEYLSINQLLGAHQTPTEQPAAVAKEEEEKGIGNSSEKPNETSKTDETEKADQTKPASEISQRPARKVTPREAVVASKQLRQISLSGSYLDATANASLDASTLLLGGGTKSKSFYKLCDYLQTLESDEAVTHVLLDLSDAQFSMNSAQLDEFARRLAKLKAKGKKLIAWLENAGNEHLAVAAQCDEIFMSDLGGIDMPSQSMDTMFYRDAMDLIGIKASVVRAGDFKGAVEPYINPVMSPGLRSHYVSMLESLNSARVSRIAKGRGLTTNAVRDLQKKRILSANDALAAGLVTKIAPLGTMEKTVQDYVGSSVSWTKPKPKAKRELSLFDIVGMSMSNTKESKSKLKHDSIAVLHLQGAITDGKSDSSGEIVSGPTVKTISDLAKDEKVKGVVVRINSPGGSATASEVIRQALKELASKKPVVFSMGEVAASGGYWITCVGQPIYAEHGTITGSIGVFTMKVSFGSLFRRVGVHVESLALDSAAEQDAIDKAWTDEDTAGVQRFVDQIYTRFLALANESRNIPLDKLQELAGGRVWSGEQAKVHGLVDEIGGLDDSLNAVAKRASIADYKVVHFPEAPAGLGLLQLLNEGDDEEITAPKFQIDLDSEIFKRLGNLGFRLDNLRTLLKQSSQAPQAVPHVWALMPVELKVN